MGICRHVGIDRRIRQLVVTVWLQFLAVCRGCLRNNGWCVILLFRRHHRLRVENQSLDCHSLWCVSLEQAHHAVGVVLVEWVDQDLRRRQVLDISMRMI